MAPKRSQILVWKTFPDIRHPTRRLRPCAPTLQRVVDRHAFTFDVNRPEAVAKRHALGQRTARENIADLCDEAVSSNTARWPWPPSAAAAAKTT
jgi:hypothetical protein